LPGIDLPGVFNLWTIPDMRRIIAWIGERRVALTGGCFQNRFLTEQTAQRLTQAGFEVLLHRHVPPNDGGISLGQIAVAAAQLSKAGSKP
jgi:hydrogenase maturation protein HypF